MNGKIHQLAKQLTLAEKCTLLSGQDMWHTHDVERMNIPGKINPGGKLSETFPVAYADLPVSQYYPSTEAASEYREGLYVGCRYATTAKKEVRFPFGFHQPVRREGHPSCPGAEGLRPCPSRGRRGKGRHDSL